LHDEIGRSLVALKLAIGSARRNGGDNVEAQLEHAMEITDGLIGTGRGIAQRPRPTQPDEPGLAATPLWHLDPVPRPEGVKVSGEENVGEERCSLDDAIRSPCPTWPRPPLQDGAAPKNPIRILVADDHHLFRAGIRALLRTVDDFEVVGEARDGAEALAAISQSRPDIVLLDVAMPDLSGARVLERLRADGSETKVVMLSLHANEEYVIRALSLGAAGYVVKDAAPDELEAAIRAAMANEIWLPNAMPRAGGPCAGNALTQRQKQVLKLIAEGAGTRAIATGLGLSVKTVETHRAQIMLRLGIQDVPGLVRYAILHGISSL
jgi:DNA-binding NarL/FixJ family response regulator